jgi:hypothetical protein
MGKQRRSPLKLLPLLQTPSFRAAACGAKLQKGSYEDQSAR